MRRRPPVRARAPISGRQKERRRAKGVSGGRILVSGPGVCIHEGAYAMRGARDAKPSPFISSRSWEGIAVGPSVDRCEGRLGPGERRPIRGDRAI